MMDLASKIVLCLALAAALGALVAWVLRGILLGDAAHGMEQSLREQIAHRDTELLGVKSRLRDSENRTASLDNERQDANTEIVALGKSLETEKAAHVAARADADAWQSRHATIAAELGTAAAALAALRAEHASITTTRDVQAAALEEQTARLAALESELTEVRALASTSGRTESEELNALKNELAVAKRQLHEKASALTTADGRIVDAFREIDRLRARIATLETTGATNAEHDAELTRLRERIATLDAQAALLPDRDARISALESQVEICTREHGDLGTMRARLLELEQFSREDLRDNLEDIYGVGPKLAQLLYSLGVNTFRQVASWTEEDIDAMDLKLEDFHGRIRRENWVASAKDEYEKKYQRPFVPLRRA